MLFWQPKTITNVVAEISESSSELNISWSTSDEFLWYNVYVANEPGITGSNIASLNGGISELGIRENSVSLSQKSIEQDYYLVVSGVDGTGESAFSSEIILVDGLDFTPPTANNDEFTVVEDGTLSGNLIANDTATGTNTISIVTTPISEAANGQLDIHANGTFDYIPNVDFFGTDQFSYQITSSNSLTAIGLVQINVTGINDLPVSNVDGFVITGDTLTVASPGLLENDFDVESDDLAVNLPLVTAPLFGTISVNTDGGFYIPPMAALRRLINFSYQASDGNDLSAETLVTIQSPDFNGYPPFAIADSYQVDEDALLTITTANGVLANDSDNDNDLSELILSVVTTTMHGELVLATDGSFSYQPIDNFTGLDSFSYQLTDPEGNQTVAVAQINVQPKNDPPVANNDVYVVSNAAVATIPSALGILTNDTDIDGDTVIIDVASVTTAGSGTVVVNANGSFVYTPQAGFIGVDSFSYRVTDGNLVSSIATVQLNVVAAHATTDDLTPIVVDLEQILGDLPSNVEISSASASVGNVVLSDGEITFTPAIGQGGISIITLEILVDSEVNNYQLVVLITTNNTGPIITSAASVVIAENLDEGSEIFTVTATDSEQDPLTFVIDDVTNSFEIDELTGVISVKNNALIDFETVDKFEFTISVFDVFDAVATLPFTINLSNVDEAPMLTSATDFELLENTTEGTLVYQATGIDPEAQTVLYSLNSSSNGLYINADGEVRVGTDAVLDFETTPNIELELVLSDGNLSQTYVIDVRVLNVNEPPVFSSASQFSLNENTPNQSEAGYTATILADPEGNAVQWTISEDELQIFTIDNATGVLFVENNTALDFETTEMYDIVIRATETNGSPTNLSTNLTVTVNILDVVDDLDTDEDGLTDDQEAILGTDINNPDSDDDGLIDGLEVEMGTDPLDEDSDDDLILDGDEVAADTDPLNSDTTRPIVINVTPTDLQTNVCTNQGITIRFNEPIRASSVNDSSLSLLQENVGAITGTVTAVLNSAEVFFRATDSLATDSNFTITISGVKDSAGNTMSGSFSSTFSTGTCVESDKPEVLKVSPWDNSVNIPRNTQIAVAINETIDPTTLTSNNFVVQDRLTGEDISGQLSLSDDNTIIRFVADQLFKASREYNVYISAGITDIYGNQLYGYQFDFKTNFSEDLVPPVVQRTSSAEGM
ncbi:Ig-like domain-containing protein [Psychrosphaera algicola]|uniref:Ig-like domain-containing protein n=1 Tax=Psychrosphaera algicola TaxID=3023714 RepID=A0ABT5FAP6_9GAMM|nr:Ig-like domain-containing protein [Psychrosphaera sp. G1-22]MDC2888616.1 Ig-like domain-containing protein [Psychrosphaera sp. G1-22]